LQELFQTIDKVSSQDCTQLPECSGLSVFSKYLRVLFTNRHQPPAFEQSCVRPSLSKTLEFSTISAMDAKKEYILTTWQLRHFYRRGSQGLHTIFCHQ
jgi:hypothetical protein